MSQRFTDTAAGSGSGQRDGGALECGRAHRDFVAALHGLDAVVWEMDARTWRFTYVSPRAQRLFGYPVTDWLDGETFWQDTLVHPEDRDWCVAFCGTASAQCRDHAFLYRAIAADGEVVWIKDLVRVIPDAEGRPRWMRGVMLDVTAEMRRRGVRRGSTLDWDSPEHAAAREALIAAA